jgi:hypothetical protein
MGYAIQMCEKQASGPPIVYDTSINQVSLDEAIMVAKARLKTAPLEDGTIVGVSEAAAVFVRVVELDSNGSPTDRVVFEIAGPSLWRADVRD